jgi:hypothetical protein
MAAGAVGREVGAVARRALPDGGVHPPTALAVGTSPELGPSGCGRAGDGAAGGGVEAVDRCDSAEALPDRTPGALDSWCFRLVPYGDGEPRLTFLTPTLVTGDRSLVNVVAHELAHS